MIGRRGILRKGREVCGQANCPPPRASGGKRDKEKVMEKLSLKGNRAGNTVE
jgi:hypothetical protein